MNINILTTSKNGLMNMLGCLFMTWSLWGYNSWDHFLQWLRSETAGQTPWAAFSPEGFM